MPALLNRYGGHLLRIVDIPNNLTDPDESTKESIGDWHYRVAQGYCS